MKTKTKALGGLLVSVLIITGIFTSCDFFMDGDLNAKNPVTRVTISASSQTIKVGEVGYLTLNVEPGNATYSPSWDYDSSILTLKQNKGGAVITGLKEGQTAVSVTCGDKSSTVIIRVSGYAETYEENLEPYIYSDTTILQLSPQDSQNIHVSLYNGTAADIDGYEWSIDKNAVAVLEPTGQYCKIKAQGTGYARITVRHNKAAYPYYIGVYVLDDFSKATYITTKNNIVSLKTSSGEQRISAEVMNPKSETWKTKFTWKVQENPESIEIIGNGNECVITPKKAGVSVIRIENDECAYPLDVTVRVVEIVDSVYIEPSVSHIEVCGETQQELSAILKSTAKTLVSGVDYSDADFSFSVEDENILTAWSFGNTVTLKGLHNGVTSLHISHPAAKYERQVLVVVSEQVADAVDSSVYITTSQNYIKTKVGAEETLLNILLKGGTAGDELNFKWDVKQTPKEAGKQVIRLETTNGTVQYRSAINDFAGGTAHITPLAEGTATITVTHPKSYYPTEILINVLNKDAILDSPLYFSGESIVRFLNSETYDYKIQLLGEGKTTSDSSRITWTSDSETLSISAAGESAVLSSTATGSHISHMNIGHPRADSEKQVLVLSADTEKELRELKGFYSDKTHYGINVGSECVLRTESVGYDTAFKKFDFSAATWVSSDPSVASVEKIANDPLSATVHGNKAGKAEITVSYMGQSSLTYSVTVYPEGVNINAVETTRYLTTGQNVINIGKTGVTREVTITAIGISEYELSEMQWTSQDESIATVIGNGTKATVTSLKEGETVISVTHPKSENTLKLYIRIGNEFVTQRTAVPFISTTADTILLLKDDPTYTLSASIVNGEEIDSLSGFNFSMQDESIAKISAAYENGKCYIKPVSAGQTELTVSHTACEAFPKKILVVVANTKEELAAFRYLSTTTNLVTVGTGQTRTVTVSVMNSNDIILDGYEWESLNPTIASVVTQSGAQAVIKGNSVGMTKLRVTNANCGYPLEIIVQTVDSSIASDFPYIQVNSTVLTLTTSTTWTTITAELIGGSEEDQKLFTWEAADSSIVQCIAQNGTGKIRALTKGQTFVTVSHPKAEYPQRIMVIADEASNSNCSISVSCGNIMSIKPTAGDTSITAQLVNGEAVDKYNFTWSLDVYDIVSLDYNANTAIITPLKEGTCTVTVHHPKSPYDQQIYIKVQRFDNFGFGAKSMKIRQGTTSFVSMEIPASSQKTKVNYSSNAETVVKVDGTDAVCQLTGVGSGTAIIHAELISVNTGVVQSEADLLVYSEKAADDETYLTGTSTVYSIEKGKRKTLNATLIGKDVVVTDQHNLEWTSSDPTVVKIEGASSSGVYVGSECYVTALKGGDCTVTIKHEKAATPLVYHIIVPQEQEAEISLNKSYARLTQGTSFDLKASISNGSNADYKTLRWEIDKPNGIEVARIFGSGQTVNVYAIAAGTTHVRCYLADSGTYAECEVIVESTRDLQLDTTIVRVRPTASRSVGYTVEPDGAVITWRTLTQSGDEYISIHDEGHNEGKGSLRIEGIKEGTTTVTGISSYGNMVTLTVYCAWDYKFQPDRKVLRGTPAETFTINYQINPPDGSVTFDTGGAECKLATLNAVNNGDGTGTITVKPKKEGKDTVNVVAKNGNTIFGEFTLDMNFEYERLTPIIDIRESTGKFSRYDAYANILYIGDGEKVKMSVNVANPGVEWTMDDFKIVPNSTNSPNKVWLENENTFYIENPKDVVKYEYYIPEFYYPYISTGTRAGALNPKTDFYWRSGSDGWLCFGSWPSLQTHVTGRVYEIRTDSEGKEYGEYVTIWWHLGVWGTDCTDNKCGYSRKRDTTKDGTVLSQDEYESTPWYWRPSFPAYSFFELFTGWHVFCGAASARQTGNQPAQKRTVSDTTVANSVATERIEFYITHNGRSEKFTIPVVVETRNCDKNCTVEEIAQQTGSEGIEDVNDSYKGTYRVYPFVKRNEIPAEYPEAPAEGEGWYAFIAEDSTHAMDFFFGYFKEDGTSSQSGIMQDGKYFDQKQTFEENGIAIPDWSDYSAMVYPFKYWVLIDDDELQSIARTFPGFSLPNAE